MASLETYLEELRHWVRHPYNISFQRLCRMAERLGFSCDGIEGSHYIYVHHRVRRRLSLQPDKNGKAKPYQIRQLLDAVETYLFVE